MDGYRTATRKDLPQIFACLSAGEQEGVLIRSVCLTEQGTHPLLETYKGPFSTGDGIIAGFSATGEKSALRITDGALPYIETREGDRDWIPPELGSFILLVRE